MVVEALVCCVIGENKIISGFRKYNCGTGLDNRFAAYLRFKLCRTGDNLLSIIARYNIYA
jgi:hypothetical protein